MYAAKQPDDEYAEPIRLQVCDQTHNRTMGTVTVDADPARVLLRDMIALAQAAEDAYALAYGFTPGDSYELRLWDGEDCAWSARVRCTAKYALIPDRGHRLPLLPSMATTPS